MRMLATTESSDVLCVISALGVVLIGYDRDAITQHYIGRTSAQTRPAIAAERKRRRVRVERVAVHGDAQVHYSRSRK